MISCSNLTSSHAMSYFQEKSDYFFNKEGKGTWAGSGAQMLGLEGSITQHDFEMILSGKHPKDGSLLRKKNGEVVRACTDLTFSAPKSLSLIAEFGSVEQKHMVHISWNDAVEKTVSYIEENNSQIREQNNGSRIVAQTGNIITARFDHALSRNIDPQLHSHVLVMNMSRSAQTHTWKALHNDSIYKDKASLTRIFHAQLASNLKNSGFGINI
jgi:conjugative relaxase-like TrwC/TraI family protein